MRASPPSVDTGWWVSELERLAGGPATEADVDAGDSYTTGGRPFYRVSVPDRRRLAKVWLVQHAADTAEEVLAMVEALLGGASHEERTLGPLLLASHAAARSLVTPERVSRWLEGLEGWAEVDALCQSTLTASDLLAAWASWERTLLGFPSSPYRSHRRAALVLLTRPVATSDDPRLTATAFAVIDASKADRDPYITKAVSWLLRSLVRRHREDVEGYLAVDSETLPALAVRETRNKLTTGTKHREPSRSANGR